MNQHLILIRLVYIHREVGFDDLETPLVEFLDGIMTVVKHFFLDDFSFEISLSARI